jgi:flagellar hook-associated protein 3 FlgL
MATLRAPVVAGTRQSALANAGVASALDNVLGERAIAGARLKEIEELDSTGEDLDIQYAATLSQLQDVDLVATISQVHAAADVAGSGAEVVQIDVGPVAV